MLPKDYLEQMNILLGEEFQSFLDSYDRPSIKSLRVNLLKTSPQSFLDFNPFGIKAEDAVEWCPQGFYYDTEVQVGKHPLHSSGVYYIQEASAMSPVMELDIRKGEKVLDLCASPGGKSTQIASLLGQDGLLVSNEPNGKRAKILSENIERMGITNALVISHDPSEISERFSEFFDKILVDAPCSGEGMFRKNEEAVTEWSTENVLLCQERQKRILNDAIKMLKKGGRLVYSTCTFAKEEDEEIVQYVLDAYSDMKLVKSEKLWPHKIKGEGHFLSVFEKNGSDDYKSSNKGTNTVVKKVKELEEFEKTSLDISIRDAFGNVKRDFFVYNDEVYLLPEDFPILKGLRVLRSGLHLGTLKKGRFEPSHSMALAIDKSFVKRACELSYEDAFRYLKGESISAEVENGWCLVTYLGFGMGWGKATNGIVKNHYPKGLRIV